MTIAIALAIVTLGTVRAAVTAGNPLHPIAPVRPITRLTPLPLRTLAPIATPAPGSIAPAFGNRPVTWHHVKSPPRLPGIVPKLSQFLIKTGKNSWGVRQMTLHDEVVAGRHVHPYAANGNTIILTGDQSNYFSNDITLAYGADVYLACEGMPNGQRNRYQYYVYPPDGSGAQVSGTLSTGNAGECLAYGNFNLSTPFNGYNNGTAVSTDAAYPGVWIVGLYDQFTASFVSETAIIANASINFTTYATLGLTAPTYTFNPGNTIVVNASGLNASQSYNIGFVNTGSGGQKCEYAIPQGSNNQNNVVCFTGAPTGLQAYGGNLTQYWGATSTPSTAAAPTGTYDIELYDTTTQEMIGHQQISIEPSAVNWTLTPYNSNGTALPTGFNYNNIFATDGLLDQSVTGLTYAATGVGGTTGNTIDVSVSDPNGVVLTPVNFYYPTVGTPPQMQSLATCCSTTLGAGGTISKQIAFPLNQTYEEALGPTQNPFAPNVLTAQLFDTNTQTVEASTSFELLGYYASLAWTSGTILSAGTTATATNVTITNTGGTNFGSWNGDAITGVTLSTTPANGEVLGLPTATETAVDSGGNGWTITTTGTGANTVITATANNRNTGIPVGGTLTFPVTAAVPSGDCTTPCDVSTSILPEHGIAYSTPNAVTTTLEVLANTVNQNTVVPTISWAVQSESATANMAARVASFDQLTYILGTAGSGTGDYYTINLTVNNVISNGGHRLSEFLLTFPAAVDLNAVPPTIVSSPGGTGTWNLYTNTTTNASGATPIGSYGQNVIAIGCQQNTPDACGIPQGSSGTFTLQFPLFKTSFVETAIASIGNFDKGDIFGRCNACNDGSYTLQATTATTKTIDGNTTVYSNMLGAYSLNSSLMTDLFTPATVGTGSGNSTSTLVFTNTSSSEDPNPDYVDEMVLTFPTGVDPTSLTPPTGWYAWETATGSRKWIVATCPKPGPTNATPCSNPEPSAVAPGGQLSVTVNWTTNPAAGTYNVTWYVVGANGGEDTSSVATTTPITFSNTTASFGFTAINGATVTSGTEPQVGTDTVISGTPWSDKGSAYQLTVNNTGSTTLNKIVVSIPHLTRSGTAGSDSHTANGGYYDVTSVAIGYTGGASGCSSAIVNPTATADGTITLSGCTIPSNAKVVITFNAQTPYLVGNEFTFGATVYQGTTAFTATPTYSAANVISVVLNGTLTILTPASGWVAPTQPNSLKPIDNTLSPQTNCVSCQVTSGTTSLIDFGVFSGTFTATDVVDASVLSDANTISSNSWELYVTTAPGTNPANMLYTEVDNTAGRYSSPESVLQSTFTPVLSSSPGLALSKYAGAAYHGPLDSVMNYEVITGGNTSPESVTLTYTLVFN
jgi:hypothetical protein